MTTAMMNASADTLVLQNCGDRCETAQKRTVRRVIVYFLVTAVCVAAVVFSSVYFRPAILSHPGFDASALAGAPEIPQEYGYSTLTVRDGYAVNVCGVPAIEGNDVYFNVTNPSDNDVWFRVEVLDQDKNVIGSSDVLKQGQYLPYITLDKVPSGEDLDIQLRVVSYQPNTWQSCGNVSLKIVLRGK